MEAMDNDNGVQRSRAGVKRPVKKQLRIDMTPMVDLGFLLISFFVITTELSKPTAMNLAMPKEGPPMPLGRSNALTVLLDGHDKIWCYQGDWEQALTEGSIQPLKGAGQEGLRKTITERQQWLDKNPGKEGRDGLMVLVKPAAGTDYKQVVDVLDEMSITQVKRYAVVKLSPAEKEWTSANNKND
jgi:biopolymer transport protein ExbD